MAMLLTAAAVAGCSSVGGPKGQPAAATIPTADSNVYPADYRVQIARFVSGMLSDRAQFHGALISQPVQKQIGDSPHYIVCVELKDKGQIENKVAIYLSGEITQFLDSTPEQCGDAAYQPFRELEGMLPEQ